MDFRTLLCAGLVYMTAIDANAESSTLPGHYYLSGVMEMGAELLLQADGTFKAGVEYGSASGMANGKWYVEDDVVTLESQASTQPAEALAFEEPGEISLAQLEENATHYPDERAGVWRDHYLLEMRHARLREAPKVQPGFVYFQFDHGVSGPLPLEAGIPARLWLPYDPQKTIRKIGFSALKDTAPKQWLEVSPDTRLFSFNWKKPKLQSIVVDTPQEDKLADAQRFLPEDEQGRIQNHYLIELFHYDPIPAPPIKPVDVYWQFADGSTQQQSWTDSSQARLTQPYTGASPLQKLGLRTHGSAEEIQWFDVAPDTRLLKVQWQAEHGPGELAAMFEDLQLQVEPNCLAVSGWSDRACFRRR